MLPITCFMLEPTEMVRLSLRRYTNGSIPVDCGPSQRSYHDASTPIGDFKDDDQITRPGQEDPRWPMQCACGFIFRPNDEWQLFRDSLYRRSDNGEIVTLRDAPVGAMWRLDWYKIKDSDPVRYGIYWDNQFEPPLVVRTPGGEWVIDSRASNCTLPQDTTHRCWVRHGIPPLITVDKNGITCAAGAGSIQCGNFHGFLREGKLVE